MKKTYFAIVINALTLGIFIFLVFFVILCYALTVSLSLYLSLIISLLAISLYLLLSIPKKNTEIKKEEENKTVNQTMIELNFSSKEKINKLFFSAFQKEGYNPIKRRNSIYLPELKNAVFLFFSFEGPSKTDVIKVFNSVKEDEKATIYSSFLSEETKKFILRFNGKIETESVENIYSLLKKTDNIPKEKHFLIDETEKLSFSVKNLLERKKAKNFFVFGLTLCFMSFFVRFKIYYLIFGVFFLCMFIISFFFGKKEKT